MHPIHEGACHVSPSSSCRRAGVAGAAAVAVPVAALASGGPARLAATLAGVKRAVAGK
jgi:hypothetical protein